MKSDGNLNGSWGQLGYSNVDYTGDNDICKSVTEHIFLMIVFAIALKYKINKTVILFVTEAEYSEIIEVC